MPIFRPACSLLFLCSLCSGGYLGLRFTPTQDGRPGVVVAQVAPESPAAINGFQAGDRIVAVNRTAFRTAEEFGGLVAAAPAGKTAVFSVERGGRRFEIAARLRESPAASANVAPRPSAASVTKAAPPSRAAAVAGKGRIVLRPAAIRDASGMFTGDAYTLLAPEGWELEGRILWRANPTNPSAPTARILNRQTGQEIGILPDLPFSWGPAVTMFFREGANYLGNEVRPVIEDPVQCIRSVVTPRLRPRLREAREVSHEVLPQLAAAGAEKYPELRGKAHFAAAKVRYQYTENGRAMEEDVYALVGWIAFPVGNTYSVYWSPEEVRYSKAPQGKLDAQYQIFQTVCFSLKPTMRFYNRRQQLVEQMVAEQNRLGQQAVQSALNSSGDNPVLALSKYIARTNDHVSAGITQSYQTRQAAMDRINGQWDRAIRGVNEYSNPWTGSAMQLPNGYNQGWVNSRGEVVLSNDPNFNPNVGSAVQWKDMGRGK